MQISSCKDHPKFLEFVDLLPSIIRMLYWVPPSEWKLSETAGCLRLELTRGWHLAFTFPENSQGFWSFVGDSTVGGSLLDLKPLRKILRESRDKEFLCHDCSDALHDIFSLKDALWNQISPSPNGRGLLCLPCSQKRVGRPLTASDFKLVPTNRALVLMWELGQNSQR